MDPKFVFSRSSLLAWHNIKPFLMAKTNVRENIVIWIAKTISTINDFGRNQTKEALEENF